MDSDFQLSESDYDELYNSDINPDFIIADNDHDSVQLY